MFVSSSPELDLALRILLLGPIALLWITFVVRVVGLRSFSKMAAFDFVVTVATGSLLANAVTAKEWPVFLQATGAMAVLLLSQALIAIARRKWRGVGALLENDPVVLMRDGVFDREAMRRNRVAERDVIAKLREANALRLDDVRAVILETTGDIAVLHGQGVDNYLFETVSNAPGKR